MKMGCLFAAWNTWHEHARQQVLLRKFVRKLFGKATHRALRAWLEYLRVWAFEKQCAAVVLQSTWRGVLGSRRCTRQRERHAAARSVQRCGRAYLTKIILQTARRKRAGDEAKARRMLQKLLFGALAKCYQAWRAHCQTMRAVRLMVGRGERGTLQLCVREWARFAKRSRVRTRKTKTREIQRVYRGFRGRAAARAGRGASGPPRCIQRRGPTLSRRRARALWLRARYIARTRGATAQTSQPPRPPAAVKTT